MKNEKIIPMVQFILEIDSMTTKEFCKSYRVPEPYFTGDIKTSADKFLQVDAIKHKIFVDYAKFLNKKLTKEILINKIGFESLEVRGGFPKFKNGKIEITNDPHGFWLEPYDSIDGYRVIKVGSLVNLGLSYKD